MPYLPGTKIVKGGKAEMWNLERNKTRRTATSNPVDTLLSNHPNPEVGHTISTELWLEHERQCMGSNNE